jgi:geranylgeranyl diphosphate synthase type I
MDLNQEIKKRAVFFNEILEKYLRNGEPESLYNAVRHLPLAGGKRLRPSIAMIACEAVSGDIKNVMPLAIALELTHNFTLVHDDIMDNSKLRRNIPSVHVKFGEPTAIIAGDLLFAKAFEAMHDIQVPPLIFKNVEFGLIDCVKEISEGQQLDMDFEKRKIVTEDEYLDMVLKKTAVLFMYAAEAGAILGGGNKEQSIALNEYGKSLGLGFQIHDDYLDMSSDVKTLGKDIGNDIRNGKKTLIAVHCLNNASGDDKKLLEKTFGNLKATDDNIAQVYNLFKKVGSIEFAKNTAIKYRENAKKALEIIPDTDAKTILLKLADYSIKRKM